MKAHNTVARRIIVVYYFSFKICDLRDMFMFCHLHVYLSTNKTRPKFIDDSVHEKVFTQQNFKIDYFHHFIDVATRCKGLVRGFKIIQIVFSLKSQSHQNNKNCTKQRNI